MHLTLVLCTWTLRVLREDECGEIGTHTPDDSLDAYALEVISAYAHETLP